MRVLALVLAVVAGGAWLWPPPVAHAVTLDSLWAGATRAEVGRIRLPPPAFFTFQAGRVSFIQGLHLTVHGHVVAGPGWNRPQIAARLAALGYALRRCEWFPEPHPFVVTALEFTGPERERVTLYFKGQTFDLAQLDAP